MQALISSNGELTYDIGIENFDFERIEGNVGIFTLTTDRFIANLFIR